MLRATRGLIFAGGRPLWQTTACHHRTRLLHVSASAQHSLIPIGWDSNTKKLTYDEIDESAAADLTETEDFEDFDMFEWVEHDLPKTMLDGEVVAEMEDEEEIEEYVKDFGYKKKPEDTSQLGHILWREQRRKLLYLRLIEHELPKLVGECYTRVCQWKFQVADAIVAFSFS